jgi:hypothetical protein
MRRLPPLHELHNFLPAAANNFIVAHTLANATTIKLHTIFARQDMASKGRCMEAAKAVIDIGLHMDQGQTVFLNPILGVSNFLLHTLDYFLTII